MNADGLGRAGARILERLRFAGPSAHNLRKISADPTPLGVL